MGQKGEGRGGEGRGGEGRGGKEKVLAYQIRKAFVSKIG